MAHLNNGISLEDTGRAEESVASYDEAIRCDPSLARAHHSKAGALATLGRNEEAPGSYDEAIRLGGPAADVYTHKGDFFARLGRVDEALVAYDEAISADRYAARAHYGRAGCSTALAGLPRRPSATTRRSRWTRGSPLRTPAGAG